MIGNGGALPYRNKLAVGTQDERHPGSEAVQRGVEGPSMGNSPLGFDPLSSNQNP